MWVHTHYYSLLWYTHQSLTGLNRRYCSEPCWCDTVRDSNWASVLDFAYLKNMLKNKKKAMPQCLKWIKWLPLCSSQQVQHRIRNRYTGQQSPSRSGPLASAGGDSQQTQCGAQCGQRAARGGRESTRHRWPQPWHKPLYRRSAPWNEGCVRPFLCVECDEAVA